MDPILLKALRALLTAQARAKAAGVALAPADQEAFLREETSQKYGLADAQKVIGSIDTRVTAGNLLRSAAQGATFNFGDEILGAIPKVTERPTFLEALKRGLMTAGPVGQLVGMLDTGEGAKEAMRLRDERFRAEHPVASTLAGIAGGFAVPGLGSAAAAERGAMTVGGAMARGAATGAAAGALAGAGEGDTVRERAGHATAGAAGGAVLGGAIPGAAGVVSYLRDPAQRAARRVAQAIEASGGEQALRGRVFDADLAGRGQEVMLGDLSDHLRAATDFAANNSDDVLVPLAQRVRDRQADASERVLGDVRQALGGDPNADAAVEQLAASRRQWAGGPTGYAGLREGNPQVDVAPIATYLQQPVVKAALAKAKETGQIGHELDAGNPSFAMLQDVKEALDDAASAAFRTGEGNRGAKLVEARDAVVAHLRATVPGYEAVAAEYARRSSLEAAVKAGQEAWNAKDSRGIAQTLAGMSAAEVEQFRLGMASELVAKLRGSATNRDVAKELTDASPAMQAKLRVVFGDKQTFDEFMRRVGVEANLARMKGAVGGSQTARRLQAQGFDPAELGIAGAAGGPAGLVGAVTSGAAKLARGAVTRSTAREMGPLLMTQGARNLDDLLATWSARTPLVDPLVASAVPASLGSLFDRF